MNAIDTILTSGRISVRAKEVIDLMLTGCDESDIDTIEFKDIKNSLKDVAALESVGISSYLKKEVEELYDFCARREKSD